MVSFLVITNLALSVMSTQLVDYNVLYSHLNEDNQQILSTNNVNSYDDLDNFLSSNQVLKSSNNPDTGNGEHSDSLRADEIENTLVDNYDGFYWTISDFATTKDVSNAIPINMQGTQFPKSNIEQALTDTGVASTYGGCGSIAMMGIMDYFSRNLGYTEIINNPYSPSDRIQLATDVLNKVATFEVGFSGDKNTLTFPWDYQNGFNSLMEDYGLENIIEANQQWTLFQGNEENYWNIIKENIDKGIPVTLMTGLWSGDGDFAKHYTNVYGYEEWFGYNSSTNETKRIKFIRARLNWSDSKWSNNEFLCNASILNDGMIGLITYDVNYSKNYHFYDYDFSEEFVNQYGGGEYFYDLHKTPVVLSNERMLYTERLRCSYIENKYLVLSPKRNGAGLAYLDILFPHSVSKLTFDCSLWSDLEGIYGETFIVQYYDGTGFKDHIEIDLNNLSHLKDYPDEFTVLFSKDVTRIRFCATHNSPSGSRNKGRVCLDNFLVEYN